MVSFRYNLELELIKFIDGLDVGYELIWEIKIFVLSNWINDRKDIKMEKI